MHFHSRPTYAALILVASAELLGCSDEPGGRDPCLDDAFGCEAGGALIPDEACMNDAELEVELGQGLLEFEALNPGEGPLVHWGSQGGTHMFIAVGVLNPDPTHARFSFDIELTGPDDYPNFWRSVVVDAKEFTDAGAFEQAALLLRMEPKSSGEMARLTLTVEDSCSRKASVAHDFVY